MGAIIFGAILIAAAVGMVFGRKKQEEKLYQMKATETMSSAELAQEAKDVEEGLGEKGSYNKIVEVKGKAICDQPLTSELAGVQCVDYSMHVYRKWEEKYWDTDSEGRRVQKTRQGTDTVASNARSVPFQIEDSGGKIKINPEGANMIREKVYSKFEPGEPKGSSIQIGRFSLNFGSVSALAGGRRTLGYSYEEEAVPVGRELYVLGEAADSSGELRMQRPSQKENKFIISVKSEEELQRGIAGSMKALLVGSIIAGIAGVVLIVLSIAGVI